MLVVASNDDLGRFSDDIFHQIEAGLEARGGTTALTADVFRKYVVTAIKVRIEKVLFREYSRVGNKYTGMRVEEGWVLPTPVHDLLSSLGEVSIGNGSVRIVPVWAPEANDLVLTKEQRDAVNPLLRSALTTLGVSYQTDIARDSEGRHQVMVLTYIPQTGEWWSNDPIAREDAHASMLLGLTPVTGVEPGQDGAQYTLVDTSAMAMALSTMRLWIPEWTMERRVVARFAHEAARIAV